MEHGIQGKNCFFESSVRVPFMVSLPGRIKPSKQDELIETEELLPTLLDLIGLPEPVEVQGRSYAPSLTDRATPRRTMRCSANIIPRSHHRREHRPALRRTRAWTASACIRMEDGPHRPVEILYYPMGREYTI